MGADPHTGGTGSAPEAAAVPPESAQQAAPPMQPNGPSSQPPPAVGVPPPGFHHPPPTYGQPVYGEMPGGAAYVTAPEPVFGIPVRAPLVGPLPGQVVVGYQVVQPPSTGCYMDLKLEGWLVVLILIIICWPLAWIPCCLPECFQRYQVPVYGYPGQSIPIAHAPFGNVAPYGVVP